MISVTGCSTLKTTNPSKELIKDLAESKNKINLPAYPEDCKTILNPEIIRGERLDITLLKINKTLYIQNNRIMRCTKWYETLKILNEKS